MKTIRVIGILSIAAAAACVSSVERVSAPDTTVQSAHESIAAMHAAIPASRTAGDAFEYGTVVATEKPMVFADQGGQVFEYN